jgi:hypothetical protein
MRTIKWEEWKKQKREFTLKLLELENTYQGRAPGRRPRDPEKEKILARMDKERMERFIATGKLQILGPRLWKWRVDFEKKPV